MDERKQVAHQLTEIDIKLSRLKAEQESLLIARQKLLQLDEQLLANNFNQYALVEDKIELFLSYFKGRSDIYPFVGNLKMAVAVIHRLVGMSGSLRFVISQK